MSHNQVQDFSHLMSESQVIKQAELALAAAGHTAPQRQVKSVFSHVKRLLQILWDLWEQKTSYCVVQVEVSSLFHVQVCLSTSCLAGCRLKIAYWTVFTRNITLFMWNISGMLHVRDVLICPEANHCCSSQSCNVRCSSPYQKLPEIAALFWRLWLLASH